VTRLPQLVSNLSRRVIWVIGVAAAVVAIVAATLMFSTLLAGSVMRYAAGWGLTWATDLTSLLFPWAALAGIVLAHQRSAHIAVELVLANLPAGAQRAFLVAIHIGIVATCLFLIQHSAFLLQITSSQMLPVLRVRMSYAYLSLPVAFYAIGIISILNAVLLICDRKKIWPYSGKAHGS